MESQQDYRTRVETTYRERDALITIGKVKENFNK